MIPNATFIDSSIALTSTARIGQAYAPQILAMIGRGQIQAVSNALVLQEIADSPEAADGLVETFNALMSQVLGVSQVDWTAARRLAAHYPGRSPRVSSPMQLATWACPLLNDLMQDLSIDMFSDFLVQ